MDRVRRSLLVLLLAGAGCASPPIEPEGWPAAVPTRAYYVKVYEGDEKNQSAQTVEDYLVWVIRFYHGYGIAEGWKKTEAKIVDGMSSQEVMLIEPKLAYYGMLMSGEWAKHNKKRRITTDMLILWGQVMTQAKADSNVEVVLDRLIADVHGIIVGELKPKEVKQARYVDLLPTAKGH